MQSQQQKQFNELNQAGVFDELFGEVMTNLASGWCKAETRDAREELWHRQRVVRDVLREFKKAGGIDVGE